MGLITLVHQESTSNSKSANRCQIQLLFSHTYACTGKVHRNVVDELEIPTIEFRI